MKRRKALEYIVIGGVSTTLPNTLPPVRIQKFNLFDEIYKQNPCEVCLVVYRNGDCYAFTTGEDKRTAISIEYLEKIEKKKIKDIAMVVHNHWPPSYFSPANNKVYHKLKNRGFEGFFTIYYPALKKVRIKK